jgi:hypothetical protein
MSSAAAFCSMVSCDIRSSTHAAIGSAGAGVADAVGALGVGNGGDPCAAAWLHAVVPMSITAIMNGRAAVRFTRIYPSVPACPTSAEHARG